MLKLAEYLIERLLHILGAPISMPKELQRRGEDSNLRRQNYWRNGLLLLLLEARCIKTTLPPLHKMALLPPSVDTKLRMPLRSQVKES